MIDKQIQAESMNLSQLFWKGKFRVPWHQRKYDWDRRHVKELLQDLFNAVERGYGCYFLGTLVFINNQNDDNFFEINDGQQRMITLSLIFSWMCNYFYSKNDSQRVGYALRTLFVLEDNHTKNFDDVDDLQPRVIAPEEYDGTFKLMIRGKSIGSNGKLMQALNEIDTFLSSVNILKCREMFDFMLQKTEICRIKIEPSVDANSVFETLNSRGRPLDQFDLLRNYFYSFYNDKTEEPRRDTVNNFLEKILIRLKTIKKTSEYARCYFQCEYGFLSRSRFYRDTRHKIEEEMRRLPEGYSEADYIFNLIERFGFDENVDIYKSVVYPEDAPLVNAMVKNSGKISGRNISILLTEMKSYSVSWTIIFSILRNYYRSSKNDRKATAKASYICLKNLNSFIMRTAFIGKFEPSKCEEKFSNISMDIFNSNSADGVKDMHIIDVLKDIDHQRVIQEKEFVERMKVLNVLNNKKAKNIFLGLVFYKQKDANFINGNAATLEHILPKSANYLSGWDEFDEESHEEYVNRLGNMTLLSDADNYSGYSENDNFKIKKKTFSDSAVIFTRNLASYDKWSPAEIQSRQNDIAKMVVKAWKFEDET